MSVLFVHGDGLEGQVFRLGLVHEGTYSLVQTLSTCQHSCLLYTGLKMK